MAQEEGCLSGNDQKCLTEKDLSPANEIGTNERWMKTKIQTENQNIQFTLSKH